MLNTPAHECAFIPHRAIIRPKYAPAVAVHMHCTTCLRPWTLIVDRSHHLLTNVRPRVARERHDA